MFTLPEYVIELRQGRCSGKKSGMGIEDCLPLGGLSRNPLSFWEREMKGPATFRCFVKKLMRTQQGISLIFFILSGQISAPKKRRSDAYAD
jgi:hypothetical protein